MYTHSLPYPSQLEHFGFSSQRNYSRGDMSGMVISAGNRPSSPFSVDKSYRLWRLSEHGTGICPPWLKKTEGEDHAPG